MTEPSLLPCRRWLRFSLRSVLLLVAVIAIPLAWKVNRVRNQRMVVVELQKRDAEIVYDYQSDFNRGVSKNATPEPPGPKWLRSILGDDFFAGVAEVGVDGPQVTNETLAHISRLPHLQLLGVTSNKIADSGMAYISRSTELQGLSLRSRSVTVASIDHLQGLPNLQFLRCSGSQVNDSWIGHIAKLKSLRTLALNDTRVTAKGFAGLAALPKLEGLFFEVMPITDADLDQLHGMLNLKRIGLHQTQVTKNGVKRFTKALPNCAIRQY